MELKLNVYKKSLEGFTYLANVDFTALQTVLDPRLIDGLENGLIQKFEILTEQSWKLAKTFLFKKEGLDVKSPKQALKSFYTSGHLNEEDYTLWTQALDDRNILSHRYDEEAYQQALARMKLYAVFYLKLLKIVEVQL